MKTSLQDRIARTLKPDILQLHAYQVADASGMIKLDAMENPYTCSKALKEKWLQCLSTAELNRYPDPDSRELIAQMRGVLDIPEQLDVLLGNGSDELIQIIATAVAGTGRCLLAPEPGFVMYKLISQMLGLEYIGVPLTPDFELDEATMLTQIETHQPAVIFIAYPNNPSGNLFGRESIDKIIALSEGLVVIDEAYSAFSSDSYIDDVLQHDNVLLMRTFSKTGLAGLRLGYLCGKKEWLSEFNKIRLPYNINSLTQLSARFFLQHYDELLHQASDIKRDRALLFDELKSCDGIDVHPSEANFLLFRVMNDSVDDVFNSLIRQKVLIKRLHGSHPLLENALRVTVGKPEENKRFLLALKQSIG